ncbi:hypothetical protein GCM10009839_21800 [Catenulispora yoronensis]|uniref:Fungal lipase-type domain-containing protein n=1 Tax=Catenulispora yoronensis TaxID=450799 RepID=A0ABN2TYY9_9ACTN
MAATTITTTTASTTTTSTTTTGNTITTQTAMTLAAIAPTGAAPRPSGETLQAQTARVRAGVARQLETHTTWQLKWLALSPDNANMAYIAVNKAPGPDQVAVVIRGTTANLLDVMEDFDVSTVVPFTASGSTTPISVSKGAMTAFTEVVNMRPAVPQGQDRSNLMQALAELLSTLNPQPGVFVIGHSLGGCVASMVALYLKALPWENKPEIGVLTFAAPTAGLADFARFFNRQKWLQSVRCANVYDLVPQAWASLHNVLDDPHNDHKPWYPQGNKVNGELKMLIRALERLPGYNKYHQPCTGEQVVLLNTKYEMYNSSLVNDTVEDFMAQVAYQHANTTYLELLGAGVQLDEPPRVNALTPDDGGPTVSLVISGSGFAKFDPQNTSVDFGLIACDPAAVSIPNDTQIIVTDVPAGFGIVDVQVTNPLGTSGASPASQFAYDGPEPVTVTFIEPAEAETGSTIVISGAGFTENADVYFGKKKSPNVELVPPPPPFPPYPPVLVATIPKSGKTPKHVAGTTVDVTVAANGYSSPTSPYDEFTYTG